MKNYVKEIACDDKKYQWLITVPMVIVCALSYAYWIHTYYDDPRIWTMVMALFGPFAIFPMAVGFPIALTIRFLRRKYECNNAASGGQKTP